MISFCHCVVFRVLQSRATISYGKNLEFSISHEIFHVLDFLRMETCSVLYHTYGYDRNPKYIYYIVRFGKVENIFKRDDGIRTCVLGPSKVSTHLLKKSPQGSSGGPQEIPFGPMVLFWCA